MSSWKLIVPEEAVNRIANPSFENNVTDGWTFGQGGSGGSRNQDSTYARYGAYSCRLGAGTGLVYNAAAAGSIEDGDTITVRVHATGPAQTARVVIYDSTNTTTRATTNATLTGEGTWHELEAAWTNNTGGAVNVSIYIYNIANDGITDIWYDAIHAEVVGTATTDPPTTYIDGDQPGCEWLGAPHNSTSQRSSESRAGGRIYDLQDDYGLYVSQMNGSGALTFERILDAFALAPGAESQGFKIPERRFVIGGSFIASSIANLHALRQDLLKALIPHSVASDQPVTLRYTGAAVDKEIRAFYEQGLELSLRGQDRYVEDVAIRFVAADPFWYEVGNSAKALDTNDSVTLRYIAARLRSTGQWSALGLTANPASGGLINDAAYNPVDGKLYIGGQWTNLDNDGTLNADHIARYNPETGAWENVGAAGALNGQVYALAVAPNGDVYLGGTFTDASGNKDYLARYDLSADALVAVGNPLAGGATITSILALEIDQWGLLWIGGQYIQIGGVANTAYVSYWDGSSYNALGTGMNGNVLAIAADAFNNIWFGGAFTTVDGNASNRLAIWTNAGTWKRFGTGANGNVAAIAHDSVGRTTIGGAFTTIDGNPYPYLARYLSSGGWEQLGGAPNNTVFDLAYGPDGVLYAVGSFTQIGTLDLVNLAAKWNDASWTHLDSGGFGSPALCVALGRADPEIPRNYDIWLGASGSAATQTAGLITVNNAGTADVFPKITVHRSGGTSATLISVRNETLGLELLLDYELLDGETLTIDTSPQSPAIRSDFWGERQDAMLKNSDFGSFRLKAGNNDITCLVGVTGAPTITGTIQWRDTFVSLD